jgi:hypothetical protein
MAMAGADGNQAKKNSGLFGPAVSLSDGLPG